MIRAAAAARSAAGMRTGGSWAVSAIYRTASARFPTALAVSSRSLHLARSAVSNLAVGRSSTSALQQTALPLLSRGKHTYIRGRVKVASKRWTKKYKLKNHKGAVARWLVLGSGTFKRAKAGRTRMNRNRRGWKRRMRKKRIVATSTQRRLLKKLIPYYKKRYMR